MGPSDKTGINGLKYCINTENYGYLWDFWILGKYALKYLGIKDQNDFIIK
jgi:hypothetical protein